MPNLNTVRKSLGATLRPSDFAFRTDAVTVEIAEPPRPQLPPVLERTLRQAGRKGLLPEGFTPKLPAPESPDPLRLSELLDKETLFRVAYVPFVIAELVWDYADTVISISAGLRLYEARVLARKIRVLRADYDHWRSTIIDEAHHQSELDNMLVFEDCVGDTMALFVTVLRAEFRKQYPKLLPEHLNMLVAVYQCSTLLSALFIYAGHVREKIMRITGVRIADVLPVYIRALAPLVDAYAGNKPVSPEFIPTLKRYAETFAAYMGRVELADLIKG